MKYSPLSLLFLCLLIAYTSVSTDTKACTTAIVSGRYTADGRPLLWKVRDTSAYDNKMIYLQDGRYAFIGLTNTKDTLGQQIWAGSNEVGFAIMNSASFNVNLEKKIDKKDQEGYFMHRALASCKTLKDFEKMLRKEPRPMGLAAHFGVIDGEGGAAFYEVNNETFTKVDANDPLLAPNGYILRTNFSFTGKKDIGYGFIRFQTAQDLFMQANAMHQLTPQTFMQRFGRSLSHAILKKDYYKEYNQVPASSESFINTGDFICRYETASQVLVQGVTKKMEADMSIVWTQVGFPQTCVTIPLWVRGGKQLPKIVTAEYKKESKYHSFVALNNWAYQWKKKIYPIERSAGYKYMCISRLVNQEKTGYLQRIEKFEDQLFKSAYAHKTKWEKENPSAQEIYTYNSELNKLVTDFYMSQQ